MFFGVSIVYLLLSSKIISDFLASAFNIRVGQCIMLLFVSGALLPVTMLKSPQDFWYVLGIKIDTGLMTLMFIWRWALVTAMITTGISLSLLRFSVLYLFILRHLCGTNSIGYLDGLRVLRSSGRIPSLSVRAPPSISRHLHVLFRWS